MWPLRTAHTNYHSFWGAGIQALLSGLHCSGSPKAEEVLPRLWSFQSSWSHSKFILLLAEFVPFSCRTEVPIFLMAVSQGLLWVSRGHLSSFMCSCFHNMAAYFFKASRGIFLSTWLTPDNDSHHFHDIKYCNLGRNFQPFHRSPPHTREGGYTGNLYLEVKSCLLLALCLFYTHSLYLLDMKGRLVYYKCI